MAMVFPLRSRSLLRSVANGRPITPRIVESLGLDDGAR